MRVLPKNLDRQRTRPAHSRWQEVFVGWIIRLYVPILIAALAVTALSVERAGHLRLKSDMAALMPEGVPSIENLRRVMKKTAGFSSAAVVVESRDSEAALRYVKTLRAALLSLPWVGSAEFTEDTSVFERHKLLFMETEDLQEIQRRIDARIDYEEHHPRLKIDGTDVRVTIRDGNNYDSPPPLHSNDIIDKYRRDDEYEKSQKPEKLFQSKDGTTTLLIVIPKGGTTDINRSRQLMRELEAEALALDPASFHPDMSVHVGGRIKSRVLEFDAVIADVKGSVLWSLAAILVLLTLYYRTISCVLYIGLPLVMGVLWTFGVTEAVYGALNVVTAFLVLVLFGLGIDFGIHNLSRYDEVRRDGGTMEQALTTVLKRTGRASLLAAITTMVGFYSLLVTDFRAFSELGFITGTGIALTYVAAYTVFPALMVMAEKTRLYRAPAPRADRVHTRRQGAPMAGVVLGAVLVVFGVSLFFAKDVAFEDDFGKLSARVPETLAVNKKIKKVFTERSDRAVVFVPTQDDVKALVDSLETRIRQDIASPTIARVKSVFTAIPSFEKQAERLAVIEDIGSKFDAWGDRLSDEETRELSDVTEYLDIGLLTPNKLPPALQRFYMGQPGSGGYLVYIYNRASMSKLKNALAFADDIREIRVDDKTYYPATEALVFVDMRNLMKKDALIAVVAVTVAVTLALIWNFGGIGSALIVLFPVCIGLGLMVGVMGLFDIRLSIFNMVVLPTVIGIGIDDAIHIYERYREEGRLGMRHVIRTSGMAASVTTITTMLGFAGMLTASNQGLVSLAVLACVGVGACLLSSLIALPALLQCLENWRAEDRSVPAVHGLQTLR